MGVYEFEKMSGCKFVDGFEMGTTAIVTDPCYKFNLQNCNIILDGVMPGRWDGFVEYRDCGRWGHRVAELVVVNQTGSYQFPTEPCGIMGVDSGQGGVFDASWYRGACGNPQSGPDCYEDICEVTLSEYPFGSFADRGFVSESGFGDGGYPVYIHRGPGGIDAIGIMFIGDDE